MFPEMARECAYKGAEVMIRTAGYTAPIRDAGASPTSRTPSATSWSRPTCACAGPTAPSIPWAKAWSCNFDGSIIAHGTSGRPDEIITAEVRPDLVREARIHWGVENNIYQFGHRGYTAVAGGAQDCPYTYMHRPRGGPLPLPWEDGIKETDGTSCGFAAPTRSYGAGQQADGAPARRAAE